ncbi:helix-turn-helix transcriptional regulator [Thioalbus denitrificans]|uniref:helix-turn-helix transcriptional regulator n=1 Tax=Thioalbus denitrificans TaxID=547122 RepID=UPI001B881300|nr:AlpA family phage regulatory protein [Thioalbus denitrificans]
MAWIAHIASVFLWATRSYERHKIEEVPIMALRMIRAAGLCRELSISRTTLWRWTRAGDFPAPVKVGGGVTSWFVHEVEAWLKSHRGDGTMQGASHDS